jgi:hypothetical protein
LKFKLESIIEILMIYKVEIRGEKEREAIEIDREVERKVRLGVKCKAATDK